MITPHPSTRLPGIGFVENIDQVTSQCLNNTAEDDKQVNPTTIYELEGGNQSTMIDRFLLKHGHLEQFIKFWKVANYTTTGSITMVMWSHKLGSYDYPHSKGSPQWKVTLSALLHTEKNMKNKSWPLVGIPIIMNHSTKSIFHIR